MMCHGPLDSLFRIVEETLEENRGHRHGRRHGRHAPSVERSIDAELARMYACGDISRDTFLRLRPLARQGDLTWTDLNELPREPRPQPQTRPAILDENAVALVNIRQNKAALERARQDSEAVAQSLDQRIAGMAEEASRLEEQAKEALPGNEERARALLAKRQEIFERSGALKERVGALRQDIQRLDDLGVELDTREQELKVLQTRERLSSLEEEIKRGNLGSDKS